MTINKLKSGLVVLCILSSTMAWGITETFSDKVRFLALTGGKQYSTTYPVLANRPSTYVSNLVTFTSPAPSALKFDEWTNSFAGPDLGIEGWENLNVSLGFVVNSMGFDIEEGGANSVFTIELFRDNDLVDQVTLEMTSQTQFFGVWTDTGFNRMEIRETTGGISDEFFGAFYGGLDKNRDRSANVPALICQFPLLAAYSFSTGAALFAPPPTDLGFDLAAYSANIGLKYCKPYAVAPPDMLTDVNNTAAPPGTFDACYKTYDHERVHSGFTALFGIPVQYDYDWGELGTPQVIHQNSDVEVYMLTGLLPPMTDTLSLSSLLGDELAAGGIYSSCNGIRDISSTGHKCPFSQGREINMPVGRNTINYRFDVNMGILDLVYIPVPKFPKGTKNKALLDLGMDLLFQFTEIVWDIALGGWRFGNYEDRKQHVVVYDTVAPTISKDNTIDFNGDGFINALDLAFIDNVVIEADEIGGVSANRFRSFLRSMYNTSDACNRSVSFGAYYPDDALRVFWPVSQTGNDQSFDLTWKAIDPGPNYQGLPNATSITQHISVVDTRPPIIQPPMDIVELTEDTQVTLDLGQPLVFDLVDINPLIEHDAVFPLSAGLHTITWTATDASGNQASTTQSVNIKNSNIEPAALALTGGDAQHAISFEPQEITLGGFDADGDPLNFFIEDYPDNGFFVAPLYPYFIEDYRLEATTPDSEWETFCETRPPGQGDFYHAEHIRNPVYFSVLDDGTTYVIDYGYVNCRNDLNLPPKYLPRLAVFDSAGQFIAGQNRQNVPNDFYININSELLYTTDGELSNGSVLELDSSLNSLMRFELFNLPDQNQIAADSGFDGSINYAQSAVMDSQGVLYVLDNLGDVHALRSDRGIASQGGFELRPEFINFALQTPHQGTHFDMAIDSADNLYVSMGKRVYKVTPATIDENGDFVVGDLVGWMGKCTVDTAPGDQAVCDLTNQRSLGYSCTDETCGGSYGESGDQPGQFNDARGIAIDNKDVLFVTDFLNYRIQRFTPEGFFAGQAESACEGNCFVLGDFGRPHDIAVNSSHFFIIDPLTNLLHISQTSPFLEIGDDFATVLYQSNNDFACVLSSDCIDTFSFSVSDGVRDSDSMQMMRSDPAVVEVHVGRNYRPPFATAGLAFEALEEVSTGFILDGSDPDPLDSLSFNISAQPEHGSVNLSGHQVTYTSDLNYVGEDSFAFTVSDGIETSAPEVVQVTVQDVNDPAVIVFNLPDAVARGFEVRLDGILNDPDVNDSYHMVVDWGDGTAPEPQGEVNMMGQLTGPILYANSTGSGTVLATHIFDTTGSYDVRFCITDRIDASGNGTAASIEHCSVANLLVEDAIDLTVANSGPDYLQRGQSDSYTITVTNRIPDSGSGLTATGIELTIQMDTIIITAAPAGCVISDNEIVCQINDLEPGGSADVVIPLIIPTDTGDKVEVLSEVRVTADQNDLTGVDLSLIRTPLLTFADIMISGTNMAELEDDVDVNIGDGVCENSSGACNLRAAIEEANHSGLDSIALGNGIFSLSLTTVVSPESGYGDLDVLQDLVIIGNGPEHTIIDAAGIDRVFDVDATLELRHLSVVGGLTVNEGEPHGAGIKVGSNSRLILSNVKISNNDAFGWGGAIFNDSRLADSLRISNSIISANSADDGAGIFSYGGGGFENVTISSNRATKIAGGVYLSGADVLLRHVTIAANSANQAGGLYVSSGGTFTVANTLLGDNSAVTGNDCQTPSGSIVSTGGNLVADTSVCSATWLNTDQLNVSANILPLSDNGGSTQTHALKYDSVARDNGLNIHCINTDQRGEIRPIDGDGDGLAACDSGAYEASGIGNDIIFQNSFE